MQSNKFFSLEQVIDRQPLTVAPETPLTEVVRLMQERANSCYLPANDDSSDASSIARIKHSCALVVEEAQLKGIFTEGDLVRLIATERDLAEIVVGEVMTRELITLTATGSEDAFTALNLLRQHPIRHLPVIDKGDRLLGLITVRSILQNQTTELEEQVRERTSELTKANQKLQQEIEERQDALRDRKLTEIALRESQERYDLAVLGTRDGLWDWNILTNEVFYAPRFKEIIGYADTEMPNNFEAWESKLHPQDREQVLVAIQNHLENRVPYDIEYRLRTKQGKYCWIYARGQAIWDENNRPTRMAGSIRDISDRKLAEADLHKSNRLLQAISAIQTEFLAEAEPRIVFDGMLERLLELTESEYGFIGEILFTADGSPMMEEGYMKVRGRPYLKTHAITNIAWNEETRAFYAENAPKGMEFHNLQTLFGAVIVTGKPVIANSPSTDPRRGGVPEGHPPLNAFLGVPFYKNDAMTGMVGIANRQEGYDEAIVDYLQPFLATCSRIIEAYRNNRQKQQAEAKIRQQAALLDLTHDTILVRNLENTITFWNQGAMEMYGWKAQEALGQNSHQLLQANFSQALAEIETDLFREERWEGELIHQRKDGTTVIVMGRWSLLKDATGNPEQILEINHDITERKQAEEKAREQAALLDVATDAIMVRGLDYKILFWNRGAEKLYGWTQAEALEQNANELLHQESSRELNEIQQAVRERGEWQGELNQITKAGKQIVVQSRWTLVKDDGGNPQSFLVVNTDITEKKQLEAEFLRSQRLESLGTLASGIAHDLNNILAPILGFAQLLPRRLTNLDERSLRLLKMIETNAKRGAALVKQILIFARGLEGDRGTLQIRHLLAEIRQIITATFPKTIELEIGASENLWTVDGDATQIHQVLMNLAVNARDAMPHGGTIRITAENFPIDANFARLHLEAHEGPYVSITVADNGMGIPSVILDRVFEPFFTTKEVGRGTGLGLSTALGIIKSHDGFIDVYSEVERGTQFKVFLPACETAEVLPLEAELPQGNGELILVVDDETQICEVAKATLETFNYQVLTANNGIDALAVYSQKQNAIDVVLTDIMMPSMNGKTLIRTIKKINPNIKIIVFSGLISNHEIMTELDNSIAAFINKPYTTEALLKTIAQVVSS